MNLFLKPETTTMTPEEAEAVVRRHVERAPEAASGPTVADMAEALRVSPEEVARLLAEVRATPERRQRAASGRERRLWLLSGLAALLIGGGALASVALLSSRLGPGRESATVVGPPTEPFGVVVDGNSGNVYYDEQKGPMSSVLPKLAQAWMKEHAGIWGGRRTYSLASSQAAIRAAAAGEWERIEGVRMSPFELQKSSDRGVHLRWARTTIPLYDGDDALVIDAVAREQTRRIAKAVVVALKGVPPPRA